MVDSSIGRSGGLKAISSSRKSEGGGCFALFIVIFLLAGLALLPLLGWPVVQAIKARSWPEVPCTILESSVLSHENDGTTYSVKVAYEYEVDGRLYRSNRYRFMTGSSSGYEGKAAVVARLPSGSRSVCYVDPRDPSRAVLDRSLGAWTLLSLIPLGFIAVGVWGAFAGLRSKFGLPSSGFSPVPGGPGMSSVGGAEPFLYQTPGWLPEPPGEAGSRFAIAQAGGGIDLEPSAGPIGKFLIITAIALFWNGIVGVFLHEVVRGWSAGHPDGCLTTFLVPFVLIGVALLLGVPYQFLALWNPRPRLHLDRSRLQSGESTRLSWSFQGAAGRIRRLKITLEGREEATYRRGTTTHTDRSTFATLVLLDSDQPASIASGNVSITIPSGSMHSFAGSNNKIVWKLSIAGEIPRWPDVSEEFDLVVLPEAARRRV